MTLDQIEEQVQRIGKPTQEDVIGEVSDACGTGYSGPRSCRVRWTEQSSF